MFGPSLSSPPSPGDAAPSARHPVDLAALAGELLDGRSAWGASGLDGGGGWGLQPRHSVSALLHAASGRPGSGLTRRASAGGKLHALYKVGC